MQPREPSRTAYAAARHRAVHQLLESGRIFADPLAPQILGGEAIDPGAVDPSERPMRIFIAVRTRFGEDALAAAVACGTRQLVVLGAGLDTFAYRNPFGDRLRVFEVDHPATQAWKRQRLAEAGIAVPSSLTFAPVDFEGETLAQGLTEVGFRPEQPSFFSWLGVVPYLSEAAVVGTLAWIASLPGGAQVVFDYGNPPSELSPSERAAHENRAARVAAVGEPFLSYFDTAALDASLLKLGFAHVRDLGRVEIFKRYLPMLPPPTSNSGGHIALATATGRLVGG